MIFDLLVYGARFDDITVEGALSAGIDCALAAEGSAFGGVWLAEHHFVPFGVFPTAHLVAAHVLARTRRIRVGTAVSVLPQHAPMRLVEDAIVLDRLSGGRFDLGVGRGGTTADIQAMGNRLAHHERGFGAGIDLMLNYLAQPSVAGDGDLYDFPEVPASLKPGGRRLPLFVAATSADGVATAAARGLPMLLNWRHDATGVAEVVAEYDRIATAHGHAPRDDHVYAVIASVGKGAGLRERLRARLIDWWSRSSAATIRIGPAPPRHPDIEAMVDGLLPYQPIGTPAGCRAVFELLAGKTSIRRVMVMVEAAGDGQAVLDNLHAFSAEVASLLGDL